MMTLEINPDFLSIEELKLAMGDVVVYPIHKGSMIRLEIIKPRKEQ